ncbi:hypothetical protein HK104_008027, partial [Borealophlyctis nickersoniae]
MTEKLRIRLDRFRSALKGRPPPSHLLQIDEGHDDADDAVPRMQRRRSDGLDLELVEFTDAASSIGTAAGKRHKRAGSVPSRFVQTQQQQQQQQYPSLRSGTNNTSPSARPALHLHIPKTPPTTHRHTRHTSDASDLSSAGLEEYAPYRTPAIDRRVAFPPSTAGPAPTTTSTSKHGSGGVTRSSLWAAMDLDRRISTVGVDDTVDVETLVRIHRRLVEEIERVRRGIEGPVEEGMGEESGVDGVEGDREGVPVDELGRSNMKEDGEASVEIAEGGGGDVANETNQAEMKRAEAKTANPAGDE